jgi:hypothetical protein
MSFFGGGGQQQPMQPDPLFAGKKSLIVTELDAAMF